jgi:hypothetical protein
MQSGEGRLFGRCVLTLALFTVVVFGPGWAEAVPHLSGGRRVLSPSRARRINHHLSDPGCRFWVETPRNLPGGGV